ncbi:16969_t:CDS:2 [Dentiscutata heterogama]|uniref:16969_t:CDS:1 n=1 Tax=Dentiscutata heterogama TaxID=1316150 RepID=A0ACA9KF53_9GLOM|nr:16969_t:CDS:2 [Dentiscutata heterogama]
MYNLYTKKTPDMMEVDTPPQKQVATINSKPDKTNVVLQSAESDSLAKELDIPMLDSQKEKSPPT